jgi:hypothetical protein
MLKRQKFLELLMFFDERNIYFKLGQQVKPKAVCQRGNRKPGTAFQQRFIVFDLMMW